MNHRELVLSAAKKARFHFLQLPEGLQDEIVDGLDGQTLTLQAAAQLVRDRGYRLSHEAIASYYRSVRRERRLYEAEQELRRIAADFASMPIEDGARSLANLMIAMAHAGLADGSIRIKDIDLGKVLANLPSSKVGRNDRPSSSPADGKTDASKPASRVVDAETIRALRDQLGL